jgi:hypothetical protein
MALCQNLRASVPKTQCLRGKQEATDFLKWCRTLRMRISSTLWFLAGVLTISGDWPHYGGGPEQTRYSPLAQITTANVASLKVAWTYDTGDTFEGSEMQCQPVVAHGVLYATSPKLRVFALDADRRPQVELQSESRQQSAVADEDSRVDVLGAR